MPWSTAVAEDGTFKPIEQLRELYGAKGVSDEDEIVAYCRIGERSSHTWFVLHELLGYRERAQLRRLLDRVRLAGRRTDRGR